VPTNVLVYTLTFRHSFYIYTVRQIVLYVIPMLRLNVCEKVCGIAYVKLHFIVSTTHYEYCRLRLTYLQKLC